ncbi:hypothetical protein PIB30_006589 [Stylosanthes scabra]|uniref:Glycosyltransferase family 92 protein n=1 Tax=Stylosanthes scabra TaxID=79078 RepID=A0ABU6Y624_9FABA|nr:hypothetical protein [Stylosanthes scabra]
MRAKHENPPTIRDIVMFPEQVLIFLNYPSSSFRFYSESDIDCVYFLLNSSSQSKSKKTEFTHPPIEVNVAETQPNEQIIRCPIHPNGYTTSVVLTKSKDPLIPTNNSKDLFIHNWETLVYEALYDCDNTTVVFVKGLNLRPERLAESSKFQCVFGWDFNNPKFLLSSPAISVAQEIVRCTTPMSILSGQAQAQDQAQAQAQSIRVSIRVKGGEIFPSTAKPLSLQAHQDLPKQEKAHKICLCTMLRNQARFLKEWVMYHGKVGIERWFIYDNNSDDDIDKVIGLLQSIGYNITRHMWPWVKTQEAGFAHCALRARSSCEWVGFIDVDEFFNVRGGGSLNKVIKLYSKVKNLGEIRTRCYSFGPSGLKKVPREGVTVGYTCRLLGSERHKSIIRPDALNQSLINVVHHFHLRTPFVAIELEKGVMAINHYKYQVWEVFKEKFYRRVSAFVADWQENNNVGSKDRVPGVGTKAVEPKDWSNRFCEVKDMRLRNWVLKTFRDRRTRLFPWQPEFERHFIRKRRRKNTGRL